MSRQTQAIPRRRTFRAVLSAALVTALAFATSLAREQDSVTFTFAPPDGAKATVTTRVRRTLVLNDLKPETPPEVSEHRLEFRTSPTGVIMRQIPQLNQNSKYLTDMTSVQALSDGLIGASDLTFRFDKGGRYLGESGLSTSLEQMRDRLPTEARAVFKQLGPYAAAQIEERWRSRFTTFLGRPFPIGKFGTAPLSSEVAPGVTMPGTAEIGVQERTQYQGRNLVKTMVGWTTKDPRFGQAISSFIGESLRKTLQSYKHPKVQQALETLKAVDLRFEIDQYFFVNERTMDPATMLTYHETFTRAFAGAIVAQGVRSTMRFRQINELTYSYQR